MLKNFNFTFLLIRHRSDFSVEKWHIFEAKHKLGELRIKVECWVEIVKRRHCGTHAGKFTSLTPTRALSEHPYPDGTPPLQLSTARFSKGCCL
jgi:hypothetical protein